MDKFNNSFWDIIDPHHQSPVFFKWTTTSVFIVVVACLLGYVGRFCALMKTMLDNIFVYFPNYLTHEMLGHNFTFGVLNLFHFGTQCTDTYAKCFPISNWIGTLAGNGVESLLPIVLMIVSLRLQGGKWLLPPLLYWSASTWYGAAVYASDARACTLHLTSSDMISSAGPGTKGDWHYILEPIGLLNQDILIGKLFYLLASITLVLAIYSAWYYWKHSTDNTPKVPEDNFSWKQAQVTAEDWNTDPFAHLLPKDTPKK